MTISNQVIQQKYKPYPLTIGVKFTDTYYLPKKGKKQSSQIWIRNGGTRIDSIRNYSLLHRVLDGLPDQFFVFYGRWFFIKRLSDFPDKTPNEILTLYTLLQGG